ncbi:hypothetical protein A11A3_16662 [Alcanivorax hongdengensis A-11-3]|uniref:DUF1853 family protein n=1 Tax=Alcanivorax hongdengensis A-11-3 TaxID=1177179 RepID=L0W9T4_9GAMM|nr:DUF1853 family protein [Alcanivorax hongdengensis]EKF72847.1 hypothetical protein A11A3_16662 [Alcanivorax hongdengensis A-11-3]
MNDTSLRARLHWLIDAPALLLPAPWGDAGQTLKDAARQQPDLLDRAQALLDGQPQPRRLGQHFEQLVHALIHASDRLELVAPNLIIRDGRQTLGELDLLVRDRESGELQHWELALKFFLGAHGQWLGPNHRDTLVRKQRHLFEQQLPRASLPAVRALLAQQGLQVTSTALLTRGRLFHGETDTPLPPGSNPAHERGWWCHGQALPAGHWRIIARADWPVPFLSDKSTTLVDRPTLIDYVESQSYPVMVLGESGTEPGFIVPSRWPS